VDDLLKIVDRVNKAIRSDKSKRTALTTTLAIHKQRIFVNGLDANGAKIGNYSTNPISISKSRQARNTGKTYFKGGYSEYKSAIGKNPGYVNLTNTGQMANDYSLIVNGDFYGFGFQNQENANKSGWMGDKYDKDIFELSDKELDTFANVYIEELNREI
jgi:hypothetical protein